MEITIQKQKNGWTIDIEDGESFGTYVSESTQGVTEIIGGFMESLEPPVVSEAKIDPDKIVGIAMTNIEKGVGVYAVNELASKPRLRRGIVIERPCNDTPNLKSRVYHVSKEDLKAALVNNERMSEDYADSQISDLLSGNIEAIGTRYGVYRLAR